MIDAWGLIWSENPSLQISAVAETAWIMEDGIFIWGKETKDNSHADTQDLCKG